MELFNTVINAEKSKKKIISVLLMVVLGLSFVSCNKTIKRNPFEKIKDNKIVSLTPEPTADPLAGGKDENEASDKDYYTSSPLSFSEGVFLLLVAAYM
jgi:hypothetical protein